MRIIAVTWLALYLVITGCLPQRGQPSGLTVRQDESAIISPSQRVGYRALITERTRATLVVQRSGHDPEQLVEDLSVGDNVTFGYCITSLRTEAGRQENKFTAQLRYQRGSDTGGKLTEFFLAHPLSSSSGRMESPIQFGNTILFSSVGATDSDGIALSIRFDRISNQAVDAPLARSPSLASGSLLTPHC